MYKLSKENLELQEIILKDGTAEDCYSFARDVKGADIEALQKRVLEIGGVMIVTSSQRT